MGRTSDWVLWKPTAIGDFTVTLDVLRDFSSIMTHSLDAEAMRRIRDLCVG